jgi:hypothetical protein
MVAISAHHELKLKPFLMTFLIIGVVAVVLFAGAKLLPALTKKQASASGQGYGSGGGGGYYSEPDSYADVSQAQPSALQSIMQAIANLTRPKSGSGSGSGGGKGGSPSGNTSSSRVNSSGKTESVGQALANGDTTSGDQGILAGIFDLQHGYAYDGGSAYGEGQDILDSRGSELGPTNDNGSPIQLSMVNADNGANSEQGLAGYFQDVPSATGVQAANGNDATAIAAADGVASDLGSYGLSDTASDGNAGLDNPFAAQGSSDEGSSDSSSYAFSSDYNPGGDGGSDGGGYDDSEMDDQ